MPHAPLLPTLLVVALVPLGLPIAPAEAVCLALPAPLLGGEVAYLPMNCLDEDGTMTKDASGSGNDAHLVNGPTRTDGHHWQAYHLNSTRAAHLRIPDASSLNASSGYSVALWVKPDFLSASWTTLMAKHYNEPGDCTGTNCAAWHLAYEGDRDMLMFSVNFADPWSENRHVIVPLSAHLSAGQWTHLVGTLEQVGTDVHQKLYVDGALAGSAVWTGESLAAMNNPGPVFIGCHDHGLVACGSELLHGSVDEVRIFARALTAQDVETLVTY